MFFFLINIFTATDITTLVSTRPNHNRLYHYTGDPPEKVSELQGVELQVKVEKVWINSTAALEKGGADET